MAASVTKTLLFTSGEIRWSSLRDAFRQSGTQIRASELLRNTTASATDPIVPDATENAQVASSTDWAASQMRNTIKTYDITQTGTNDNSAALSAFGFNIGTQDWNANLGKNIKKRMIIDGTIGSSNVSQYACYLNEFVHNLRVEVNGGIYGQGGSGSNSGQGESGGPALYVNSTGGKVNVVVGGTANIFGGGAGGSKGIKGADGNNSTCTYADTYNTGAACNSCPSCTELNATNGDCKSTSSVCSTGKWWTYYYQYRICNYTVTYDVLGALGGQGGKGGDGQGYTKTRTDAPNFNETDGPTRGATGGCVDISDDTAYPNPKSDHLFYSLGGNGYDGQRGSHGGAYGTSTNPTSAFDGGIAGRAITGSNYEVTGSVSATTIKGAYQP